MSLTTPDKIRTLQRKLYLKAKAEPDFRFYLLYDKVYRADILRHAYDLARANRGAPGVDGVDFAVIEAAGLEDWLAGIETELRTKTYQPQPVRRVMIPKPGGGERPLGIPTIRDRVVQTAVKLVLEPIFEADLEPTAYGYRPGRSGIDAVKAVHRLLCQGFTDVVDADLSKYFDTIPHDELLRSVAARIVDRHVLRLIKVWLKAPVEETDPDGRRHMSGGKHSTCGTPQGGVISPLLANRYMNRFLRHWRNQGRGEAYRAHIVNYGSAIEFWPSSADGFWPTSGPSTYGLPTGSGDLAWTGEPKWTCSSSFVGSMSLVSARSRVWRRSSACTGAWCVRRSAARCRPGTTTRPVPGPSSAWLRLSSTRFWRQTAGPRASSATPPGGCIIAS